MCVRAGVGGFEKFMKAHPILLWGEMENLMASRKWDFSMEIKRLERELSIGNLFLEKF